MKRIITFSFICAILFTCLSTTIGQSVSLIADPATNQQQLKIESESAGLISIRGDEIIGIDWNAPAQSTILAPWISYRDAGEQTITLNGKPIHVINNPTVSKKIIRPGVYNSDVYIPTIGWTPSQPVDVKRNLVIAGVSFVLIVWSIRLLDLRPVIRISIIAAVTAVMFILVIRSPLFHREELIRVVIVKEESLETNSLGAWNYIVHLQPGRYEAFFSDDMEQTTLYPRSRSHLQQLDPVIIVNANQNIQMMTYYSIANNPVAIYQPGIHPKMIGETDRYAQRITSPELIRKVYRRDYVVENGMMVLKPSKTKRF